MSVPPRGRTLASSLLLLSALPAALGADPPWVGLVAAAEGQVAIAGQGIEGWRSVHEGTALTVSPGGAAWLLCPDGHCRRLEGDRRLDAATCAGERTSPCRPSEGAAPASFLVVAGGAGGSRRAAVDVEGQWSLAAIGGGLLLGRARADGERWGELPIWIAPRCPHDDARPCGQLTTAPRELLFAEVADARRYVALLRGPGGGRVEVAAADLECRDWPGLVRARVCAAPWPATWSLSAGEVSELALYAEVGAEIRQGESAFLILLPDDRSARLARELAETRTLPHALGLLRHAETLLEQGLPNELAPLLRAENALSAQLEIALADADLRLELPELARARLLALLARGDLPSLLEAEARLLLGACALRLGERRSAGAELEAAGSGYRSLGLADRAAQADDLRARLRP